MKKPTISEIAAYCTARNNTIDAETFFHHYESNGWQVGKSPMRNWKSAVITWEKRNPKPTQPKDHTQTEEQRKKWQDDLRTGKTLSFQEVGRRLMKDIKGKKGK